MSILLRGRPRERVVTILVLMVSIGLGFVLAKITAVQPQEVISSGSVLSQEIADVAAGEIYGALKIGQSFVSPDNGLYRIDLLLATYARENDREVIFRLRRTPEGEDLATIRFNASEVRDNSFYRLDFPPISDSAGESFYFFLESPDSEPGNAITIWGITRNVYDEGRAYRNHRPAGGEVAFRAYTEGGSLWKGVVDYVTNNALQILMFLLYSALTFCVIGLLRYRRQA